MEKTDLPQLAILKKEKNKQSAKKFGSLAFFLGPYAFCFLLFVVFPFIYGIIIAFCKFDGTSLWPSNFAGFDNFTKIFTNKTLRNDFWGAVGNTLAFDAVIVPLCMVVPLFLAILIYVKPFGYKFFRACIYLPGIFPLTATGLILLKMFSRSGFINSLFNLGVDWFGGTVSAWFMVGLFCLWGGIGGNFIIFSAGLENVDKTLFEAAEVDGCSTWQKLKYVMLPGIAPQITLCLFTTLIGYMNLYGQNFILTSGTENQDSVMTAIYRIQNMLMSGTKMYGYAAAMAIYLGALIATVSGIQMAVTKDREGGQKHAKAYMEWEAQH